MEGVDSGLGEAPPTSDKKMRSPPDDIETEMTEVVETLTHKTRGKTRLLKLKKDSLPPSFISDETEHQPLRKSSRKKPKKDSEPDKILEEKQKKSLEKVAEWLMKVPTEGSLELDKPDEDAGDSDSCSSASTIDINTHNRDVNTKREERSKALEEQVFGAVYKRERRGKRTISPPLHVLGKTPRTKETRTVSKMRKRNTLTPADKSESSMEEEQQGIEEENDTSSDIFSKAKQKEATKEQSKDKNEEESNKIPESDKIDDNEDFACSASDIGQLPHRKSNRATRYALQQVDSDFQEQAEAKSESAERKQSEKRKSKNKTSEKSKPARVPKPLVLVGVTNGETSPKARPRSEEVQVHIENYPSSEDQEIPVMRITRRSRRLQVFAEEVQEGHKKANLKANTAEKGRNVAKQSEEAKGRTLDDKASTQNGNATRGAERNGCIFDQELEEIENVESGERISYLRPEDVQESIAEVPNVSPSSEARASCHVVPSSTSPAPAVVEPTLGSDDRNNTRLETFARQAESAGTEDEEDRNDSELDTEQLLKSFKATKRKSFLLGAPNVKRSRGLGQENLQEADVKPQICSGVESAKNPIRTKVPGISTQEASRDNDNSSWSDFISPSNSPAQKRKPVIKKPDQEVVEASVPDGSCSGEDSAGGNCVSRNSVSSALTPNKVSKRDIESPHLSVGPLVLDSGLCFRAAEDEELNEPSKCSQGTENQLDCTGRDAGQGKETGDEEAARGTHSVNGTQRVWEAESSLTPNGLGLPVAQIVHEATSSSCHSSVDGAARKRTRARRLESSLESEGSEEGLPTLTEIFGTSAPRPPPAVTEDPGREGAAAGGGRPLSRPAACPSPDGVHSSQGSVDLFGTPEECKLILTNQNSLKV
ncbi:hypothetical protein EYF80_022045 [Liparis tanakae]|uniref:Uncharacterized protein n=1 Tax=Liparis tanakae TaxID=230148 RepID=A0A4Z2HPF2_9TELE|nr:hypothetical protein EYF80_022045 [Liparis tanakae]